MKRARKLLIPVVLAIDYWARLYWRAKRNPGSLEGKMYDTLYAYHRASLARVSVDEKAWSKFRDWVFDDRV